MEIQEIKKIASKLEIPVQNMTKTEIIRAIPEKRREYRMFQNR